MVETVEPSYTSQQCSKCGCTLEQNRDGQHFLCLNCSYSVNADYNAVVRLCLTGSKREAFATAKNIARKLALKLQRGQKSPAGGAFCQYALKSGTMTVNATDVASDTYVSAERESTDKPTASAVGS